MGPMKEIQATAPTRTRTQNMYWGIRRRSETGGHVVFFYHRTWGVFSSWHAGRLPGPSATAQPHKLSCPGCS